MKKSKVKKVGMVATSLALTASLLAGCGGSTTSSTSSSAATYKVGMVTDTGGINDQSFNQSAWTGLKALAQKDPAFSVKYLESTQSSDYTPNFNQFSSNNYNLVWGIGFLMMDAITAAAKAHPTSQFAIVDDTADSLPSNLTCVVFKAQESSFLVGYIAALKTQTNKVGFVGGIKGTVIDQFEYGFRAGVAYGAKQMGKSVDVNVQYANSFSDAALGKGIAQNMYAKGADIIFSAAGNVGQGVITEAKDENKLVEGVDLDQSYLAPNNVLTSAMKNVGTAVSELSQAIKKGENYKGKTVVYGLKEGGVGIPYTDQSKKMCGEDILNKAKTVQQDIIDGKITPPSNSAAYDKYVSSLK